MAQIQTFLQQDNAIWLHGDETLLADKLCVMAGEIDVCLEYAETRPELMLAGVHDPYAFMRGTVGLFMADVARLGHPRVQTQLVRSAEVAQVLLIGDPHPENLGTVFREPETNINRQWTAQDLRLAWLDFDASTYGAYTVDLRRAVTGLNAYVFGLEVCNEQCREQMIRAFARSYIDTIQDVVRGIEPTQPESGFLIADLFDEAVEEGQRRKKFAQCTESLSSGLTRLRVDDDECRGLRSLGWAETKESRALFDAFQSSHTEPFRILDAARRFGQGVSSLPAHRYILLVDRGQPGPADDVLLNARMVVEPPVIPSLASNRGTQFRGNRSRIETATHRLWTAQENDPYFAAVELGNRVFKVHTWTSYFQDIDRGKMQRAFEREKAGTDDLLKVAQWIGFALAGAHVRGGHVSGRDSGAAIAHDLAGYEEVLINELLTLNRTEQHRLASDHGAFQCLLKTQGVLAGLDRVAGAWP